MTERHLLTNASSGYELIDSGGHEKLERWGAFTTARPDTQAIWEKRDRTLWEAADARFAFSGGKGSWKAKDVPDSWVAEIDGLPLTLRLTNFKHTGAFPEQAPNWGWAAERIRALGNPSVLNLFGYTGAASVSAARAGASVTHVDSSKSATAWAGENAERAKVPENSIRFIVEDARAFVKRELRRKAQYDGIILDPPAFGRGAKDEVWKIEDDLLPLLHDVKGLLAERPGAFLLINGYAAGYAPLSFAELAAGVFPGIDGEYGELRIEERGGRQLPCGMYVRFARA